jgi:hypothetical protein
MKKTELIIIGVIALGVVGVGYMWATAPKPDMTVGDSKVYIPRGEMDNATILKDAFNAISGQLPAAITAPTHHDHVAGFKT